MYLCGIFEIFFIKFYGKDYCCEGYYVNMKIKKVTYIDATDLSIVLSKHMCQFVHMKTCSTLCLETKVACVGGTGNWG